MNLFFRIAGFAWLISTIQTSFAQSDGILTYGPTAVAPASPVPIPTLFLIPLGVAVALLGLRTIRRNRARPLLGLLALAAGAGMTVSSGLSVQQATAVVASIELSKPDGDSVPVPVAPQSYINTSGVALSINSVTPPLDCTSDAPANECVAGLELADGESCNTRYVGDCLTDETPLAVDDSVTVLEDSGSTSIAVLSNDTDSDGGPISIAALTQPAGGAVAIAGNQVTYEPAPDFCNEGTPTDDFTYTLAPGGSVATVRVTVSCVNDAPSYTAPDDVSVPPGEPSQSLANWATPVPGPANESGQTVTFAVSNDNTALFAVQPVIDASGTLAFEHLGVPGSATVSVIASDDGGTANGGSDTSVEQTFTLTVENCMPPSGDYVINMHDSYGDGWQTTATTGGPGITITWDSDVDEVGLCSLFESPSYDCIAQNYDGSDTVTVPATGALDWYFPGDYWPSGEISFEIYLPNGALGAAYSRGASAGPILVNYCAN